MATPVSEVYSLVKDYVRNQNLDSTRAIRAIDSSADFVFSHLGIPGQEKEYSFDFFEDQSRYPIPTGYGEPIWMRYEDDTLNRNRRFTFKNGELLFERIDAVSSDTRLWGTYFADTNPQLIVIAKNSVSSMILDSCDSTDGWAASLDASNLHVDPYTKEEGVASLAFDISNPAGGNDRARLTKTISAQDWSTYIDIASFRVRYYLQDNTITSLSFNWGNSVSVYYKSTVTTQADGSAFVVGWNILAFPWIGATQVGTVDTTAITSYWIDLDYDDTFAGGTSYRIDDIRLSVPDRLINTYYTTYKAKTSLGVNIQTITALTDVFNFGSFDPAIKQIIALYAAVIINPQILVNDASVRKLYQDFTTLFMKKYPKKRTNNLLVEPNVARTSE